MNIDQSVDILLVEDNPYEAQLTIRSFKKNNLANRLLHIDDGAEALDYIFARNKYATRLCRKCGEENCRTHETSFYNSRK